MDKTAPLTDDELAALDEALGDDDREKPGSEAVRYVYRSEVRRLIADLRAAQDKIKELEARIADCSGSCYV